VFPNNRTQKICRHTREGQTIKERDPFHIHQLGMTNIRWAGRSGKNIRIQLRAKPAVINKENMGA
jgi:hypothetical protein